MSDYTVYILSRTFEINMGALIDHSIIERFYRSEGGAIPDMDPGGHIVRPETTVITNPEGYRMIVYW